VSLLGEAGHLIALLRPKSMQILFVGLIVYALPHHVLILQMRTGLARRYLLVVRLVGLLAVDAFQSLISCSEISCAFLTMYRKPDLLLAQQDLVLIYSQLIVSVDQLVVRQGLLEVEVCRWLHSMDELSRRVAEGRFLIITHRLVIPRTDISMDRVNIPLMRL